MNAQYPYQMIAEKLRHHILRGYYKPGTFLPSIRTLAKQEGYNPATICRVLEILKREELVISKGALGFQINDNGSFIESKRKKEVTESCNQLYSNLSSLGFSKQEILSLLKTML